MIAKRNGRERLVRFFKYLKLCIFTLSLPPYENLAEGDKRAKIHFSIAVALGVVTQAVLTALPV
jgi:hypothetical protein